MSKFREDIISNCQKQFLLDNLKEYTRLDGRAFDEFRDLVIEFGKDLGCCYVSLGKTRVVAQVSCEIQVPKSNRPSDGVLNIDVELSPLAAANFEAGRASELSIQLNCTLEKCIKDSKAVDLESLCIKASEEVWALRVDINVLNHEGNMLDCASVAALTALAHFRRPDVTTDGEGTIIHRYSERDPIPTVIHHYPVCISYAIFNENEVIVADPTLLEEGVADANLMISLNAYKEICGLHLGGSASLDIDTILGYAGKAATRACHVVEKIKEAVQKDNDKRLGRNMSSIANCKQFDKDVNNISQTLELYIDKWVSKKQKRKWKKQVTEENMETNNLQTDIVKSLEKGSAVLIPAEGDNPWGMSDDETEDAIILSGVNNEQKKHVQSSMKNHNSDSEEEAVVILNTAKTNKKARKKTKKKVVNME